MANLSHYMSLPYTRVLRRDEDGDVIASVMELPGCRAHGETEVEALRRLDESQRVWIQQAIDGEVEIPLPQETEELPSGKFLARVPRTLHRKLNQIARQDETSLNALVLGALSEFLGRREQREETKRAMDWKRAQEERPRWRASQRPPSTQHLAAVKRTMLAGGGGSYEEDVHSPHAPSRSQRQRASRGAR